MLFVALGAELQWRARARHFLPFLQLEKFRKVLHRKRVLHSVVEIKTSGARMSVDFLYRFCL